MENDRRAKVAAEIRAELGRHRLTKVALVNSTGISKDTLRRRLNGDRPFYLEELDAICSFLQVPLSEFLARTYEDAA
jgi:DNA-binding Xre family transcriptional regulator